MYAPLFASLFMGSMMGRADLLLVWACLLAHADRHGVVDLHPNVLSAFCGIPIERVEAALAELEGDDLRSRTKDPVYGGRRIRRISGECDWGWFIINHSKYRALAAAGARNDMAAERMRRMRDRDKEESEKRNGYGAVRSGYGDVTQGKVEVKVEREGEERASAPSAPPAARKSRTSPPPPPTLEEVRSYWREKKLRGNPDGFHAHHETRGWLLKGGAPILRWKGAASTWSLNEARFASPSGTLPFTQSDEEKRELAEINRKRLAELKAMGAPKGPTG